MVETLIRRQEFHSKEGPNPFDEILPVRKEKGQEDLIIQTFDGTYKQWGVVIDLEPKNAAITRARLYNLIDGSTRTYEPNSEGKWRSSVNRGTIEENSGLHNRLYDIAKNVQEQLLDWKTTHQQPIWKWSTYMARKGDKLPGQVVIDPQDWYGQYPLTAQEQVRALEDLKKTKHLQRREKQREKRITRISKTID